MVQDRPALARELRSGFERDRLAALARAEALMTELPPEDMPTPSTLQRVAALLANEARRPASFFRVKKIGTLSIGIGSAADERYLFRIEGGSPRPEDDVILEVKEVRSEPLSGRVLETTFSDYRRVDGLLMPHRLTTVLGGRLGDTTIIEKLELNPRIDDAEFRKLPSRVEDGDP